MTPEQRRRFDTLVEEAIAGLPKLIVQRMDEIPVIVIDQPTDAMLRDLGMSCDEADELCGLHTGVMDTEASVEHDGTTTSEVHLFRIGIVGLAGGWLQPEAEDLIFEQIRITLLHEYGHQHGLDEEDLDELGFA
jgi:predicted Zn-dependent protease with MMP-like domain